MTYIHYLQEQFYTFAVLILAFCTGRYMAMLFDIELPTISPWVFFGTALGWIFFGALLKVWKQYESKPR